MTERINNSINYVLDRIIYPIYDYTTSLFVEC
jgi:hypothetical protein